jgi:serine/threonine protein kinase
MAGTRMIDTSVTEKIENIETPCGAGPEKGQPRVCTPVPPPLTVGRELGPYRLLEWLGRGAEGDVWKAVRVGSGGELVALKVLKPSLARSPARKAQFRREAQRGTAMIGPSLLRVRGLHEVEGRHFISFSYVEATSLRDVLRWRRAYLLDGDMDNLHPLVIMRCDEYQTSVVSALAQATRALATVHDQRIVHRDIKPANILMDNRRTDGVYLCDFGLGRDLDVATPDQMRDGSGTPLYMAPERLLRQPADEIRCDIYSMGVTLCEALTLKRPFDLPDDLALGALAPFLSAAEPIRPTVLRPELPDALEGIIMRAMARLARHRYESATELADALDRFAVDATFGRQPRRAYQPHVAGYARRPPAINA